MFNKSSPLSLSLAVLLLFPCQILAQRTLTQTVLVEDTTREYLVYLPADLNATQSIPILFCFHGGDMSAEEMMRLADFRPLANSNRFIVVYPKGLIYEGATHWNSEGPYDNGTDEIGFARAMIDALVSNYGADRNRVYACGFSLGGNLMWDYACLLGDRFAAVASVAASMWQWTRRDCATTIRTGILSIHGTNDFYNPYNGNQYSVSIDQLNNHWVTINGIQDPPLTSNVGRGVTRYLWEQENVCHTVEHYRIERGEHEWPSFSTQVIWDFVSRYDSNGLIGCGTPAELIINAYQPETGKLTITVSNLPEGRFELRKTSSGTFDFNSPGINIDRNTSFPLTIENIRDDALILQIFEKP